METNVLDDVSSEADGSVVMWFDGPPYLTVRLNAGQRRAVSGAVGQPPFDVTVGGLRVLRGHDEDDLYLHAADGWTLTIDPEDFDELLAAVEDRDRPPGTA